MSYNTVDQGWHLSFFRRNIDEIQYTLEVATPPKFKVHAPDIWSEWSMPYGDAVLFWNRHF